MVRERLVFSVKCLSILTKWRLFGGGSRWLGTRRTRRCRLGGGGRNLGSCGRWLGSHGCGSRGGPSGRTRRGARLGLRYTQGLDLFVKLLFGALAGAANLFSSYAQWTLLQRKFVMEIGKGTAFGAGNEL